MVENIEWLLMQPITFSSVIQTIRHLFSLADDKSEADSIDAEIRSNVALRGTNLWVLILAILIASIGLDVNSTAVVIGAMLISPLMGPILFVVALRASLLLQEKLKPT